MYIHLTVHGSTVILLDLGRFFSFVILYTVHTTPWTGDQPVARPLPTHRTTQTQIKCTDTHALSGIRTTIPAFERAKTVYALDRVATVRRDVYSNPKLKYNRSVILAVQGPHVAHPSYIQLQVKSLISNLYIELAIGN
jgi:hypothetical protein